MMKPSTLISGLLGIFFSPLALAYMDPGSGSMLLQVILGGAAAVGVLVKMYWYRLKHLLGFGTKPPADQ